MLLDTRRFELPALGAGHALLDVRTPHLRVARMRSRGVVTDFGLLDRAMPFAHRMERRGLTVLIEGEGRFEEGGRRRFLAPGDMVLSDLRRGGTEAYSGAPSLYLVIEWEPGVHGGVFDAPFVVERLDARTLGRVAAAGARLDGPEPAAAISEILALLRAAGAPLHPVDPRALTTEVDPAWLAPLQSALSQTFSSLQEGTAVVDLENALGWNQRQIHRRMSELARTYRFAWGHFREAAHQARLLQAMRVLGVPGATTELAARHAGFHGPSALCHAFAKVGLPSPGRLAQAARHEALGRWSELAEAMDRTG